MIFHVPLISFKNHLDSKTRIEASSLDELEEREQEFINDLRKEDEFFHTENTKAEIQLLG